MGYKTYTHRKSLTGDKQVIKTGMCKEIEAARRPSSWRRLRAQRCADQQRRYAGIYGMAGLVLSC